MSKASEKKIFAIGLVFVLSIAIIISYFIYRDKPSQENLTTSLSEEYLIKIIAFGDSLTAGYGVAQADAYPAQLEASLNKAGYKVRVINAGVSGETTRGNLERAQFIRSQDPDLVILGIGGNDALRALPLEETKKNISNTIDILRGGENPPAVLLLQIQAPLNAGISYKEEFDKIYTDISKTKKIKLISFITPSIFLDPRNKLEDGIHFNKLGYEKVVEEYIFPLVREVISELN